MDEDTVVEQVKSESFKLTKDQMLVIGALSVQKPIDVLQAMPMEAVEQILTNREKISARLNEIRLKEVDAEGRIKIGQSEINMEVNM